ncbi:unnamed protein product [Gadus morhua 'NCC']
MSLSLEMTKTGKPDSHWAGVMTLYAQGKYKFSTGQRPGGRRWRAVIQRINACPLTPVFNQTPRKYDIFGKKINCECGYHEPPEKAGAASASSGQLSAPGASSAAGRAPEEPASAAAEGRAPGELASTSAAAVGQENPAFVTCSLCTKEVMGEDYTQHLSDYHVQERWWRCNALHTQMYMLEGLSKWNINRAQQALNMSVTSQTRIYDVRLMSSVNALSNRVLGSALLQEFTPPGKPTGELIAVEYLLAQSNRGDLLSAPDAIGANLPEGPEEVQEDEFPDETIPQATDILFPSSSPEPTAESEGASRSPVSSPFEDSGPITSTPDSRCDPRGIPGWEAVDALAGRKRSGSAPGQQAAERLFMVHGQAAHRPDYTRVSECVALKLFKEFKEGRNRPKDPKGRTFPIPQAIIMTYGHIKQLIEDCQQILQSTNLVLVTINNTTVSSWLQDRQKRADRDSLLQGVELPQQVHVAEESLLEALDLPSEPVSHGHADLEFEEPDNREGEAVIRRRRRKTQVSSEDAGGDDAWTVPFPSSSDLAYSASNTGVSVSGLGLLPTASSLSLSGLVGALISDAATTTSSPLSELVLKPAASSSSLSGLLPAATSARFSTSRRTF